MKKFSLMVCALLLMSWSGMAHAAGIGSTAVVRNSVTGALGENLRNLRRGNEVYQNELISTSLRSMTRLKFLDDTKFTIGANSQVLLSSFVYAPNLKRGRIAFNAVKGAFRFVSGKAHSSDYTIMTPLASTGVRGTTIDGYVDQHNRFNVLILRKGAMVVCRAVGNCANAVRPGTYVLARADGNVAVGEWRGSLRPLIDQHMFDLFPPGNIALTDAAIRDFEQSFPYILKIRKKARKKVRRKVRRKARAKVRKKARRKAKPTTRNYGKGGGSSSGRRGVVPWAVY